ncbi:MAG: right-handed parallel beta-helix repeat-containing protein [Planctomycetaceae bacterium]
MSRIAVAIRGVAIYDTHSRLVISTDTDLPTPLPRIPPEFRMTAPTSSRRSFLGGSLGTLAALAGAGQTGPGQARADEPQVIGGIPSRSIRRPRATSGDRVVEPAWNERLTVTVGPRDADIVGTSHKALQAAINYVAGLGGGTVQVLPGEYLLRGSLWMKSNVRLLGSGLDAVLKKHPSHHTKLAIDSDWYDQEITLEDAAGFAVGDSVLLRTKNPHNGGQEVAKRTLVARSGNRFKLDKALRQNYWQMGDSTCWSLFPLVTGEEVENVTIENLCLDGNREKNAHLDGNYGGCLFFQDCHDLTFRKVTARNNHGDGISWQICHDTLVEECHSHDNADLGLHPGSGSQRPVMRNNRIERNKIGIFFCWGVQYGLAENNQLDGNTYSISLGHRDTDNIVRNNTIKNSGEVAVLFRPERGPTFCAHRNLIEGNTCVNTGPANAAAIDVQGGTELVTIRGNRIQETRGAEQRVGIRLGKDTKDITLAENSIDGVAQNVVQMT